MTATLHAGRREPIAVGRMLGNETGKGLRILWSHKATLIPQLAMMWLMYLLMQLLVGGGHIVHRLLPLTLFAYVAYVIGYITVLRMAAGLLEEVNAGTLEQTHLSPLRAWQLSLGRLAAALVEALATGIVTAAAVVLVLGVHVPVRPAAVVPFALTVADIAGFALLLGGLALIVNSIGAIIHVVQMVFMLLNGSLIPLSAYPTGIETVGKLMPTTLGGDATRRVLFGHETLAQAWAEGSLAWALLHAAVTLLAGWVVYQAAVRKGLRDGRLGP